MGERLTIYDYIVNKLKGLSIFKGNDGTVRVYEHADLIPQGFPACAVLRGTREQVDLANTITENRYEFTVRVYQDVKAENKGRRSGERVLTDLEDTIFDLFNGDLDLGGNVIILKPILASESQYLNGEIKFFDITLTTTTTNTVSL